MVVAILTDFGNEDNFVGVMKGVMLKINPRVQFVDITNLIPPGDIKKAGFRLFTAYRTCLTAVRYFPKSTIFLVVIDPGVGSSRLPIIVKTKDYYFVGPDNGVFSWIYENEQCEVYKITSIPKNASNTFHGRDIFAPIAAKLSTGIKIEKLGSPLNKWVKFNIPAARLEKNKIYGEVIDIDKFGNLITDITSKELSGRKKVEIKINKHIITELKTSYKGTRPIAIFGSSGFLELSLPNGNCAKKLGAKIGTRVTANII